MLRHIAGIGLVGVLLATPPAFASDSTEATGDRMTHFYLAPTREEFDAIQEAIKSNLKEFEAQEEENGTALLAAIFLARVAEKYHYPLLDIGHLDDTAKSITDSDGSKISKYVRDDSQVDPGKLDIWWISYFATGDTYYLDNILAQVADPRSQSGVSHILVAGAASWSVSSNCQQHPAVLAYIRSVLARTPPPRNADTLRDVIAHVGNDADNLSKDTPWSKADGGFGVQLGLTADPNGLFDAWNKPGPMFAHTETDTARRGSMVMAFVIFTGCAKNARGMCEVTVHYQAYSPNGNAWSEPQDGELWVDKPPPPVNSFQLGIVNLGLVVEQEDVLGLYKVEAIIRDKVAGKRLSLERRFTAIEAESNK